MTNNNENRKTYTVAEVASMLGLSLGSIYRKCKRHDIPHIRSGKKILFNKKTFDNWFEGGAINAKQ